MGQMREVLAKCLEEMMRKDPKVVLIDSDLASANGTLKLRKLFPERALDVGIAEQNMASVAAGMASYGLRPYITSFAPFATRRLCDQMAISIAYAKQNVKIIGTDPGITAELNGGTHMGIEDIGVVRSIPGMTIFEPSDSVQLAAALPVIDRYVGPVYMRFNRRELADFHGEDYQFDLFRADVLREGTDVTVAACGLLVGPVLKLAEKLYAEEGISVEVLDVHTIKPIDEATLLASTAKTGCCVTVENHNVVGGLHSAVLEALAKKPVPCTKIGILDRSGEVGKLPYLREAMKMTDEDILLAIKEALALKK